MYRSIECYYKAVESIGDIWSVCIPSYGRPKAKAFKLLEEYGEELNLNIFVREEEYDQYKYLKKMGAKVHKLRDVHNIGQTREAILQWAVTNKKANIFMLDDDIFDLDILTPQTPVETLMLRSYRFEEGYHKGLHPNIFRYWMYMVKNDTNRDKLILTGAGARSVFRDKRCIDFCTDYNSRQIIQCFHINVKLAVKNRIHFGDSNICGVEDMAFQYDCMSKGLLTRMYSDLMYDVPKVGVGEGGCNASEEIKVLSDRYKEHIRRFKKNVADPYKHEGLEVATNRTGDLPSIKFKWNYWRVKGDEY